MNAMLRKYRSMLRGVADFPHFGQGRHWSKRRFGNRAGAIRCFGQDPNSCSDEIRIRARRLELDRAAASGYGDREHGVAPEFRRGKWGDGPLMRQFGHTRALRSPLSFAAVGFAGDGRLGGEVSYAPGCFFRGSGWSEHERVGGNSAPDRRRRRALRVSRFEFRDGMKAASRLFRSAFRGLLRNSRTHALHESESRTSVEILSPFIFKRTQSGDTRSASLMRDEFHNSPFRRSDDETILTLPGTMVEEAPRGRSGMYRAGFTTRLARPVPPMRRDAPDGVFATAVHRAVKSVPPCAPFANRRGFPSPLAFAGIRADEERVPCRKFR